MLSTILRALASETSKAVATNEDVTAEVETDRFPPVKVDKTLAGPELICKVNQCHMSFGSDLSRLHAHHQTHDIGEPATLLHTGRSCWHASLSPAAACAKAPHSTHVDCRVARRNEEGC